MFRLGKQVIAVAAGVGVSAVSPAVALADTWKANGVTLGGVPGVAVASSGSLAFTINIGVPITTTCNVQATVDLFNQAGIAQGRVTGFGVASPATNCTVVGVPNCRIVSVASTGFPWAIDTSGTSTTVTGVIFTYTYSRINPAQPCALEGNRQMAGNVTGTWSNAPGRLTFTNATGLLINGTLPTTINGSLNHVGEAGEVISLS